MTSVTVASEPAKAKRSHRANTRLVMMYIEDEETRIAIGTLRIKLAPVMKSQYPVLIKHYRAAFLTNATRKLVACFVPHATGGWRDMECIQIGTEPNVVRILPLLETDGFVP